MAAADDEFPKPAGEEQHSSDQPEQKQQEQQQHTKKARYSHQKEEEDKGEEDIDLASSSEDEYSEDKESEETSEPLAQDAITLTLLAPSSSSSSSSPSLGHGWSFHPEFTHQFFDDESVPVGYPDLVINLSFNGTTAEWRLTITYDEAAGREEKKTATAAAVAAVAAAAAGEEERGREAVREKEGEGNDVPTSTAASAHVGPPDPLVIGSSNQGDDEALLRCLLPVIPSLEGCSCTINHKEGWLLPDRGFVQEEEGREGGRGMPMAVLPFGEERARYVISPRPPRKKKEEEEEEEENIQVKEPPQPCEFAIHHACLNAYGLPDSSHPSSSSSSSSSSSFSSIPSSPRAIANFHRRVQKLAPWFIENGDDVDPEGGEWEVLYLLAVPPSLPPSLPPSHEAAGGALAPPSSPPPATAPLLVGYLTLFAFTNPLKGKSLRLCQALILPPFQRQGHGQRLLREGWRVGRERGVVYELTVEDPAPGFVLLRNVTDVQDVKRWREGGKEGRRGWVKGKFECLAAGEIKAVQKDLKITKAQVVLAFECLKLLEAPPPPLPPLSSSQEKDEEGGRWEGMEARHRLFRLMVKRRMAREVEGEYEGRREELQAYLEKKWRERLRELEEVCRRAGMWEGGREGRRNGEEVGGRE